jgi:DNA-binding NarL/FixJ family response regulator
VRSTADFRAEQVDHDPQPRPSVNNGVLEVALVSPSAIMRAGLRRILETTSHIRVVDEGANLRDAQRIFVSRAPTVLIVSLPTPDLDGEAVAVLTSSPSTHVLLVVPAEEDVEALAILGAGVSGCVFSTIPPHELIQAVDRISRGNAYLDIPRPLPASRLPGQRLTTREVQVLELVAKGYTTRQIAERLGVSARTVEAQRASIRVKTGAQSRADLVSEWQRVRRVALRRDTTKGGASIL